MSDFRDRLKFAAARAAGASRTSAELRERAEPRADADTRADNVVELPAEIGDDATVTLAMVRSASEAVAADD